MFTVRIEPAQITTPSAIVDVVAVVFDVRVDHRRGRNQTGLERLGDQPLTQPGLADGRQHARAGVPGGSDLERQHRPTVELIRRGVVVDERDHLEAALLPHGATCP